MSSVLLKKSWRDLSKKKARTIFVILTIAIAVSGIAIFSVAPMSNEIVRDEVEENNLYEVQIVLDGGIDYSDVKDLESIPNIKTSDGHVQYTTKIYVDEKRMDAMFIGVNKFDEQKLDLINKRKGELPGNYQVLTELDNSKKAVYKGDIGDTFKVVNNQGKKTQIEISGKGRSLAYGWPPNAGIAAFYTDNQTIEDISGIKGFNVIEFDLHKTDNKSIENTVESIKYRLSNNTDNVTFAQMPEIREQGTWPGKDQMESTASLLHIVAYIALFSSVFLIANTMNSFVKEQVNEIGSMKAIGATKKQVLKSYFMTSLLLGIIGSAIGTIFSIFISYKLVNFSISTWGLPPQFSIHLPTILIGFSAGVGLTVLASLPALYKVMKTNTKDAMKDQGVSGNFGKSRIDKILMKAKGIPKSIQMGIRNIARKKGRSIATILQISIAIGSMLALSTLGASIYTTIDGEFDSYDFDVSVNSADQSLFNESNQIMLQEDHRIKDVEGVYRTQFEYRDTSLVINGFDHNTDCYTPHIKEGSWYESRHQKNGDRVIVITKKLKDDHDLGVGDDITFDTPLGKKEFKIIGIDKTLMNNGNVAFIPITTLQDIYDNQGKVTGFFIQSYTEDHDEIDALAVDIEDKMVKNGYPANTNVLYLMKERNIAQNRSTMQMVYLLGLLIVTIGVVGLTNTLSMNIVERIKEIGILRTIGARGWDLRSIFGFEGITLALFGWILSIPIGYLMGSYIVNSFNDVFSVELMMVYPLKDVFISLGAILLLTTIVMQLPLLKVVRFKPGEALRYE